MVSHRCKMAVKDALIQLNLHHGLIELGTIELLDNPTVAQYLAFKHILSQSGLELIDDKKAVLIERIKNEIIEMVHYQEQSLDIKFSSFLADRLQYDYTYLSNLFSDIVGTTIEHFVIIHKIERVKALIHDDELNLTQISYLLHYSSIGHLSNQFKKVTGQTPSHFKKMKINRRLALENL